MTSTRDKINPEKKPLEELTVLISENGVQKKVPALSSHFAGDRPMIPFILPPLMGENGTFDIGAKEEWFHKMEIFKANLEWLLGLPHHRFWSQIVFGKKTWDSVISYLQEAYPFYAVHHLPNDYEIKERYNNISYLVFCVICRVATQKESEDSWIGKAKYGELLYENAIVSLPLLFDLCMIFGNDNKEEIHRIVSTIFSVQPLYKEDLDASEKHLRGVLNTIEDKLTRPAQNKDEEFTISKFYDLSLYILDLIVSLHYFIDAYSEGAMTLHLHTFEVSLAQFYDVVFPNLEKKLHEIVGVTNSSFENLAFTLNQSRVYSMKLYYLIIQSCLNVIIENRSLFPEELLKFNAESFLNVISETIKTAKLFVRDYQKIYPLEQDLDVLSQIYPEIKNDLFQTILMELKNVTSNPTSSSNKKQRTTPSRNPSREVVGETSVNPSKVLSEVEINSLISEVKDILPHLGEGFILKCLEFYDFKSSMVINTILENTLPESLQLLDPELPIIPPEEGVTEEKGTVLSQRVNVFDNDEFDIMTRTDVDKSRIHRGKRKDKDAVEILNDKSFREELRDKFSKLGIVDSMDDVYDDEYDDTYDDRAVPVKEDESEPERAFVTPRVLQEKERHGWREYDEEDDDDEEEQNERRFTNGFVPFAENPEVIRARREQARMSKMRGPPPQQRDVVGKARGQGQDSDVLRNRAKKQTNKSSYANHNRKKGAQFKRSVGFIPS